MWNVLVLAVIGLLTGAVARWLYPGRQPRRILGTVGIGMVGALVGGMISWIYWPGDGEFHIKNYILAIVGSMLVIVLWSGWAYARSVSTSWSRRGPEA